MANQSCEMPEFTEGRFFLTWLELQLGGAPISEMNTKPGLKVDSMGVY